MRRAALALIGASLVTAFARADAQIVRGVVVDSASGMPVAQFSVTLLGESGRVISWGLAGPAGHFALRDGASGNYRAADRISRGRGATVSGWIYSRRAAVTGFRSRQIVLVPFHYR
ncbi:MAG: hypothetical protein ABJD07_03980 [Gemmatimonadaceae bacterium]